MFAFFRKGQKTNGTDWRTASQVNRGPAEGAGQANPGAAAVTSPEHPDLARTLEGSCVTVGEIEAYRCWQVVGDHLSSMCGTLWIPSEPMSGRGVDMKTTSGVHAFKRYADALNYTPYGIRAIGKVSLWGTVVEHETGYRGEFGRAAEILTIVGAPGQEAEITESIRKNYKMEAH